jgi:Tol biopolymer transport system component
MSQIFVSYAHTTARQAHAVAQALRALGYDVWLDDELPTHRAYSEVIEERLRSAKAVVVLWSADAVKSQWVRSEANRGREDGKLVQLALDNTPLPMPYDQIQCADMSHWDGDILAPSWRKVIASVAELTAAPERGAQVHAGESSQAAMSTARASASSERWRWQIGIALGVVAVALGAILLRPERAPDRDEWVQLTNFPDSVAQPALSPDGRMLAFVRGAGTFQTEGQIYVKQLPDGEPKQLTHDSSRKMSPAFSPDGSQIAYTTIDGRFAWDTWVVSAVGGEPRRWLPNASGLVWIDQRRLLFSEIKRGIHMAIVTAEDTRAGARDVYVPAHQRGMGHRSYPSPDGESVLVVEMDVTGWTPCRLMPMDGRSAGHRVGPAEAGCTFAGWSPDGRTIYLSASAGGVFHLWQQELPDGAPEQITSGPTEEEGIAVAPDGRSVITAVGLKQRTIVLRDASGDRQISLEGYAFNPKFTRDGTRLFYQAFKSASALDGPSDLWVADVQSGRSELFYSGIASAGTTVNSAGGGSYDLSPDGRRVLLTAHDPAGKLGLWLIATDRSSPPVRIPGIEGHQTVFGPRGELVLRIDEGTQRFLYRVREDGRELRKAIADPGDLLGISPDGTLLVVWADGVGATAYPLDGGEPVRVWGRDVRLRWTADSRFLFMSFSSTAGTLYSAGRTYIIPLEPPRLLPDIPSGGFQTEAEISSLPGVMRVEAADVAPGPTASVLAFSRESTQRNLYRIPIE